LFKVVLLTLLLAYLFIYLLTYFIFASEIKYKKGDVYKETSWRIVIVCLPVFTGSSDGTVVCWDIARNYVKRRFIGPSNSVVSAMLVTY